MQRFLYQSACIDLPNPTGGSLHRKVNISIDRKIERATCGWNNIIFLRHHNGILLHLRDSYSLLEAVYLVHKNNFSSTSVISVIGSHPIIMCISRESASINLIDPIYIGHHHLISRITLQFHGNDFTYTRYSVLFL